MVENIAGIDGTLALFILGGTLGVMVIGLVMLIAYFMMRPRMILKKRIAEYGLVSARGGLRGDAKAGSRQHRIQERLRELEDKNKARRRRNQIRTDILQAGLDASLRSYFIAMALIGLVVLMAFLASGFNFMLAFLSAVATAFLLPRLVLKIIAKYRQKKFTLYFANAIDILVRGIKSGLPVGECLNIIARESPDPVGMEFYLLSEGQKVGVTLETLLARGLERIPTSEYRFFAIVLQIQQQTGGNLAETLENLSNVLRERKRMRDKVKSMSSEAKASAAIIGSLPFFVAGVVSLMAPNYLEKLFITDVGNLLLLGGLLWMGLGIIVMSKMINFEV